MALQLGYTGDDSCWDNCEPVTLEITRHPANRADTIPRAKRRNVRGREKSPSGGVYAGYEVRWHLPARLLAPEVRPKPGDVIIDQDGVRWTVLTVDRNRLGQTWALGCVDLVLANDLRDTIDVEEPTIEYDRAGAAVKRFPSSDPKGGRILYASVPARVQQVGQEQEDQRGIRAFLGKYDVIVGKQLAVTFEGRVKWGSVYLDIKGVRNPERIDELQVLECEARP